MDAGPGGFNLGRGPCAPWPRDGLRDPVVVVCLSRLVYRKGCDLLALVVPHICAAHPNVNFVIGVYRGMMICWPLTPDRTNSPGS